jgi:hypothetical protein
MTAISTIEEAGGGAFPAFAMADLITDGLHGQALREALHDRFPATPRAAVYDAIGIAVSMLEVDLLLARAERDEALRRLAERGS